MTEGTRGAEVVAVDVGGTFTDVVHISADGVRSWKTSTTDPQSDAVMEALERAGIGDTGVFLHGTTVATNALIEEKGARVVLVTSEGFEDLIEIGRQKRPSLYDNAVDRPRALVDREHRIGYGGAADIVDLVAAVDPESVAIALIDSYRNPSEEVRLSDEIGDRLPDVPVSIGSKVSAGFREYERFESTVIDAYLKPLVGRYLRTLDGGVPTSRCFVMSSAGGLLPLAAASESVGQLTLSGPAAGVVAVEALRRYHSLGPAVAFDMGGTSTDVCWVDPDSALVTPSQHVGGRVNRVPSIPIHTVGAGGGSIAWVDPGGSLRVGPRSAGASPGPAAYGQGGEEPTVTDANLVLGHIPADAPLAGGLTLDVSLAERALATLGANVGMSAADTAAGIIEIVDAHMERAIRMVSVEEGFDPRQASLVAYGGAGGLHASRLARRLQMRSVLIPPFSGAFSAVGLALALPRYEITRTLLCPPDAPLLGDTVDTLRGEVALEFDRLHGTAPSSIEVLVDGRFEGQAHEIMVPYRPGTVGEDVARAHERRFGFALDESVEVVNVRVVAVGLAPLEWPLGVSGMTRDPAQDSSSRSPHRGGLQPGASLKGPLSVVDALSTTLVAPDENLTVLDDGTMEITW